MPTPSPQPYPPLPDRPTPRQVAGFYGRSDIAARFNASRALPAPVLNQWAELIARHTGHSAIRTAVDLGCGTGRFTGMLAGRFGATVLGLDPSAPMLVAARSSTRLAHVHFVRAAAEDLPLASGRVDLVLLSMVYHHFADEARALASVRRVVRTGGWFCVRTCTTEALDSYVYQRLIPEARAVDEARLPTRAALSAAVERAGFRPAAFDTVHQPVAKSLDEYVGKVSLRAHSDLQAISDEQFHRGLAALRAWAATQDRSQPVVEDVDLFTFAAV